jgi:hypothetical protein
MAEIVTLIIFVLLLALSAVLAHKDEEAERLVEEIARRDQEMAVLQEKAEVLERFARGNDDIESYFQELVLKRQEVIRLESEKAALVEKAEAAVTELEQAQKSVADLGPVKELLERAGIDTSDSQALDAMVQQADEAARVYEALKAAGLDPSDSEALEEQLAAVAAANEAIGNLVDENTTLRERVEYFRRVASGRSNLLPPCWINPDSKKAEYIFDIALTAEGIVVHDRDIPRRRDDKAALPIGSIVFGQAVGTAAFLDQTRGLYERSDSKDCRFYVRVFDQTGATEKALYKQRLRTVEGRFYKYEVTDPDVVPGI